MTDYIFQGQTTGGDASVAFEHDGETYKVGDEVTLTQAEHARLTAANLSFKKAPKKPDDSSSSGSSSSSSSSSDK